MSGGSDNGHSQMFSSRGLAPARFRGQDFRPPMFPPCGRFDSGPRGMRPPGPSHPSFRAYRPEQRHRPAYAGIARDYERPGSNKADDGVRPNRPGFGRGGDTGPPPKGRGNPSPMRGISGGQLYPRAGSGHVQTTEKKNLATPTPVPERANRFGRPVQDGTDRTSSAANQMWDHSMIQSNRGGVVQTRPAHSAGMVQMSPAHSTGVVQARPAHSMCLGQTRPAHNSGRDHIPFSPANRTPARNTVPQTTSYASTINYIPVTVSAGSTVHTCTVWNPISNSVLYGQPQPSTTLTMHLYQTNATVSTTTVPVSEQYSVWPGAAQPDDLAYYNSYLQTLGVPDATSFVNMSMVPGATSNTQPASSSVPTNDMDYASQAMAYANSAAAAYYNAFYAAGGYADPAQAQQLQNYLLYSHGNNEPA